MQRKILSATGGVIVGLASMFVQAEDRALVIGVGHYQNSEIRDLSGIDIDTQHMTQVLKLMKFKDSQIKVLLDRDATYANIKDGIENWVAKNVKSSDRAVVYYSGHGTQLKDQNGDEEDNLDEVILPYDSRKEGGSLVNVITDDEMAQLLAKIPSKNTLVIFDACHSGTATKNITLGDASFTGDSVVQSKFFSYDGMNSGTGGTGVDDKAIRLVGKSGSYVALTATQDNEVALASNSGSFFTLGLVDSVKKAAMSGKDLTPEQLREHVDKYIKARVRPQFRQYTPSLSGDSSLIRKPFILLSPNSDGPVWSKLEKISRHAKNFNVSSSKSRYKVGESINFIIDIPTDGYLNVVSIDAKDNATVLFPNEYERSNKVSAGKLFLPTAKMDFDLTASDPRGKTLTVAFVTKRPVDFYKDTLGNRDASGKVLDTLGSLSTKAIRAVAVQPRNKLYAGSVVVTVN